MVSESQEIKDALAKNDEEWQKRMLLFVMTMIIAFIGLS
jgi:hypothetical protein